MRYQRQQRLHMGLVGEGGECCFERCERLLVQTLLLGEAEEGNTQSLVRAEHALGPERPCNEGGVRGWCPWHLQAVPIPTAANDNAVNCVQGEACSGARSAQI